MGYNLVKGEFSLFYNINRHVGSRPDGDSIWFKPDNPNHLMGLGDPPRDTEFNKGDFAQLRFEGIDALELHYKGGNQKKQGCVSARDKMLDLMGFTSVVYAPNDEIPAYVRSSTPTSIRGYILTRNIDPFRRPVAFIFKGTTGTNDGNEIWLDVQKLNNSINAKIMEAGEAYPAYYAGLPSDLRGRLDDLANSARQQNKGMWSIDSSMVYSQVTNINELQDLAIWPKLFRRLYVFFKEGNNSLGDFENWLRDAPSDRDDSIWIISQAHLGNMHDIFEVSSNSIRMIYQPEDLVIVPR
jgi:endonuclease YncB( thermonuclease family)